MQDLPSALDSLGTWVGERGDRRIALFLDFDGTVTPIVARPELAVLSAGMRDLIESIARHCSVAFVTGRDLDDIRARVGIGTLDYAGSHGFSIRMADGFREDLGEHYLAALDAVHEALQQDLGELAGLLIERKRFAISVHTRGASARVAERAAARIDALLKKQPDLILGHGKKVIEIRPAMAWHKGSVVRWMLNRWQQQRGPHVPIFIGDDVTDEDAFRELHDDGMTVIVGSHGRKTQANYRLPDVESVRLFLDELQRILQK